MRAEEACVERHSEGAAPLTRNRVTKMCSLSRPSYRSSTNEELLCNTNSPSSHRLRGQQDQSHCMACRMRPQDHLALQLMFDGMAASLRDCRSRSDAARLQIGHTLRTRGSTPL